MDALFRQRLQQVRPGDAGAKNLSVLGAHANDVAFLAAIKTGHGGAHAQVIGEKDSGGTLSGADQRTRLRRLRLRLPGRVIKRMRLGTQTARWLRPRRIFRLRSSFDAQVDDKGQALSGLTLQTKLQAMRRFVPAHGLQPQVAAGDGGQRSGQIEIGGPQLCGSQQRLFSQALFAEFCHDYTPCLVPETLPGRHCRRLGLREQRGGCDSANECGENDGKR